MPDGLVCPYNWIGRFFSKGCLVKFIFIILCKHCSPDQTPHFLRRLIWVCTVCKGSYFKILGNIGLNLVAHKGAVGATANYFFSALLMRFRGLGKQFKSRSGAAELCRNF